MFDKAANELKAVAAALEEIAKELRLVREEIQGIRRDSQEAFAVTRTQAEKTPDQVLNILGMATEFLSGNKPLIGGKK